MPFKPPQPDPDEKWVHRVAIGLLVFLGILILGVAAAHAELVYGDWRCALAHCVRIAK